jgi:hypothetical protein
MSRFVALKYRDYRLLWIGSLISWTGSEMSTIALTWMLYQMTGSALALGTLYVGPGGVANLLHTDEHGCNAIGPGTYRLVGKREMADEIRRVRDDHRHRDDHRRDRRKSFQHHLD